MGGTPLLSFTSGVWTITGWIEAPPEKTFFLYQRRGARTGDTTITHLHQELERGDVPLLPTCTWQDSPKRPIAGPAFLPVPARQTEQ